MRRYSMEGTDGTNNVLPPPAESARQGPEETDRRKRLVSASTATCRSCSEQQTNEQTN